MTEQIIALSALTCVASKLMRHIISGSIMSHASEHNLLYPLQHGFRNAHSCETQLLSLCMMLPKICKPSNRLIYVCWISQKHLIRLCTAALQIGFKALVVWHLRSNQWIDKGFLVWQNTTCFGRRLLLYRKGGALRCAPMLSAWALPIFILHKWYCPRPPFSCSSFPWWHHDLSHSLQ